MAGKEIVMRVRVEPVMDNARKAVEAMERKRDVARDQAVEIKDQVKTTIQEGTSEKDKLDEGVKALEDRVQKATIEIDKQKFATAGIFSAVGKVSRVFTSIARRSGNFVAALMGELVSSAGEIVSQAYTLAAMAGAQQNYALMAIHIGFGMYMAGERMSMIASRANAIVDMNRLADDISGGSPFGHAL